MWYSCEYFADVKSFSIKDLNSGSVSQILYCYIRYLLSWYWIDTVRTHKYFVHVQRYFYEDYISTHFMIKEVTNKAWSVVRCRRAPVGTSVRWFASSWRSFKRLQFRKASSGTCLIKLASRVLKKKKKKLYICEYCLELISAFSSYLKESVYT